jgi:hypothetical protein
VIYFFPSLLILLDVGAAATYIAHGDIRRTIYWLSAAALTACITY